MGDQWEKVQNAKDIFSSFLTNRYNSTNGDSATYELVNTFNQADLKCQDVDVVSDLTRGHVIITVTVI